VSLITLPFRDGPSINEHTSSAQHCALSAASGLLLHRLDGCRWRLYRKARSLSECDESITSRHRPRPVAPFRPRGGGNRKQRRPADGAPRSSPGRQVRRLRKKRRPSRLWPPFSHRRRQPCRRLDRRRDQRVRICRRRLQRSGWRGHRGRAKARQAASLRQPLVGICVWRGELCGLRGGLGAGSPHAAHRASECR